MDSYGAVDVQAQDYSKVNFGGIFTLYMFIGLLFNVMCTQGLKYLIRRERPARHTIPYTVYDVRKHEEGTYAMPSGDSAACTLELIFLARGFNMPYLILILPVVMFSRVYN